VTCRTCGATHWRNAKPCAGALVTHAGRLLLVQRAINPFNGHWDIPDEHPADAAVREVREETGLDVRITGLLGMWMDRYGPGTEPDTTLNCYFHAVPAGDDLTLRVDPEESTRAEWFAPDALPHPIAFPDHAVSVLTAWRASTDSPDGERAPATDAG